MYVCVDMYVCMLKTLCDMLAQDGVYVCIYMCMGVYAGAIVEVYTICTCICMYVHTHTHTYIYTHTHAHTHTHTRTHTHTYAGGTNSRLGP